MINLSAIFDAYLNVNILLAVGFLLWFVIQYAMRCIGLQHDYRSKLRLLNGLFLVIFLSPVIAIAVARQGISLSVSDMVVSRYLEGGFSMRPSELEQVLGFRENATSALLSLNSPVALTLAAVIGMGAIIAASQLAFRIVGLRRLIRRSYAWRKVGCVNIRLSDEVSVPFSTRGLRERYVVIPSVMLSNGRDMRITLSHELTHLRNHDLEWEVVLEALRPLFFWNPAFHFWKRSVERLRELACDQDVLTRHDAASYGACLLRVCEARLKGHPDQIGLPTVALIGRSESLLKQRFSSMFLGNAKTGKPQVVLALFIPLVAATMLTGISLQKSGDWSHDRLMLSSIVNLERMRQP